MKETQNPTSLPASPLFCQLCRALRAHHPGSLYPRPKALCDTGLSPFLIWNQKLLLLGFPSRTISNGLCVFLQKMTILLGPRMRVKNEQDGELCPAHSKACEATEPHGDSGNAAPPKGYVRALFSIGPIWNQDPGSSVSVCTCVYTPKCIPRPHSVRDSWRINFFPTIQRAGPSTPMRTWLSQHTNPFGKLEK